MDDKDFTVLFMVGAFFVLMITIVISDACTKRCESTESEWNERIVYVQMTADEADEFLERHKKELVTVNNADNDGVTLFILPQLCKNDHETPQKNQR